MVIMLESTPRVSTGFRVSAGWNTPEFVNGMGEPTPYPSTPNAIIAPTCPVEGVEAGWVSFTCPPQCLVLREELIKGVPHQLCTLLGCISTDWLSYQPTDCVGFRVLQTKLPDLPTQRDNFHEPTYTSLTYKLPWIYKMICGCNIPSEKFGHSVMVFHHLNLIVPWRSDSSDPLQCWDCGDPFQ